MTRTMMRLLPVFVLACTPQPPDESMDTAIVPTSTASGPATGSTTGTTDPADSSDGTVPPPEPEPEIDVMDFSRCDGLAPEPECIVTDETCICGPACSEYGPAGFPGRCPFGDFAALCPGEEGAYACVIPCTLDADCPDPTMVCRPCPDELQHACNDLGNFYEDAGLNSGFQMCTWPTR